ncbi:MAG TPA: metallophosphoesterase [Burkholderiales bacterium]|jgi:predicted phosphodiesterase|nr:metallophosphoesterase [Burkholderiales bacterium]
MRIRVLSDLHLEFSDRHPPFEPPEADAEVVVLAGDIDNGTRAIDWAERAFSDRTVIYVPGNHEYYEAELPAVAAALRARAKRSPNVRLLDNAQLVVGDVRFIGATLWTDFELFGRQQKEAALAESLKYVVDFRAIRWDRHTLFTPERSITLHRAAVAFLEECLARAFRGKTVVVTHHAPHPASVHPRWAAHLSSAAFVSDLTRLLGRSDLWIHGHTHDSFDYRVNGTRIVANPMGYRTSNWPQARSGAVATWVKYENALFDPALTVAV